jgi:hypothetical protein
MGSGVTPPLWSPEFTFSGRALDITLDFYCSGLSKNLIDAPGIGVNKIKG